MCCLLWEKELNEGPYTLRHVDRLQKQVAENLTHKYRFFCLTNSESTSFPCDRIEILGWPPGYWSKIHLFRPGMFPGRTLYFDLDVTINGNLDDLVDFPWPFAAIRDYVNPLILNSSVMVWDAGVADRIYEDFTVGVMNDYRGDQNFITHQMPQAARFPRKWCVSYRGAVQPTGQIPDDARVVVYHGQPKSWDLPA